MSQVLPSATKSAAGLRQMAERPRDSDGVGTALRQVFGRSIGLPADISALLARLNQND